MLNKEEAKKIAYEKNSEFQEKILAAIIPALQQLNSTNNKNNSIFSENDVENDSLKRTVNKLLFNRRQITNRIAKSRKTDYIPKEVNQKKVQKTIILTIEFTNTPFWLTQSLASLYRKLRLLSSLHQILEFVSIISHSISHERKLEAVRMSISNPQSRIITRSRIWNICVIDNIDFKQSTFMWEIYNIGNLLPPANVVILKASGNPNNNDDIAKACDQYFIDLNINNDKNHTNKDMCSVLLVIYSSYGIYNLAALLGVKFLNKLEQVVDYRSTYRVLDLIWRAVGCALNIYAKKNGLYFKNIMNEKNNLLKVWYLFFEWAGKMNYIKSTVNYLALLTKYPKLCVLLEFASSINLTQKGHFYAFDEALETFGVKFIKENITGNIYNIENLKRQIKAAQAEKERMDLLFGEFIDDIVISKKDRAVDRRHELFWILVKSLLTAFDSSNSISFPLF
ncbi:hypothetical protein RclHR1_03330009 [Rhizophagus clarus]|uniref:Uncharacterized protein n=1 Tax=Rhizophagus clarus TaxID=94130 RepID=A0A2Z6RCX7_9GLOM|nr:hypothetical protein RclHR1_03330009 [Rhizophagus clarus]